MDTSVTALLLEEIRGFEGVSEYETFEKFIRDHVIAGNILEIEPDAAYGVGELYGGRWFIDIASGATWRLIPPDFPFRGVFEAVRR